MTTTLPKSGPVERFAQVRAALTKAEFLAALPGVAAFIRLDERGGDDEPAPWAFHGSGLPLPVDIPSTDEDVFVDRTKERTLSSINADESTMTGPTFQLSIPPARGRATLLVVPKQREVSLGRDKKADISVPERSVSKNHATLLAADDGFTIVDNRSQNGTAVNGLRAEEQKLKSGDVVELGDVSLLFLDAAELWDGLPRLQGG